MRRTSSWCLEAHDLVLSKCVAGRERDWQFAREASRHGLVDPAELKRRVADLPLPSGEIERIRRLLAGII
ncbi:MAG TPA: hypothetical protein VFP23_10520 [Solirubrobacterales bacterium]|nr:hypothetical protein [Solirubrobacterales bacterium]